MTPACGGAVSLIGFKWVGTWTDIFLITELLHKVSEVFSIFAKFVCRKIKLPADWFLRFNIVTMIFLNFNFRLEYLKLNEIVPAHSNIKKPIFSLTSGCIQNKNVWTISLSIIWINLIYYRIHILIIYLKSIANF